MKKVWMFHGWLRKIKKGFTCLKTLTDPGNRTSDARVSNSWSCDNGYLGDLRSNLTCDGWRKQNLSSMDVKACYLQ